MTRRVCAAVVLTLVLPAIAVAQQKPPFEPQVGQAGKDVVWVPTPQVLVEKMLDLAKVTPQDVVVDLGTEVSHRRQERAGGEALVVAERARGVNAGQWN